MGRQFNSRFQEIIRFLGLLTQAIIYLFLLILAIRLFIVLMGFIW